MPRVPTCSEPTNGRRLEGEADHIICCMIQQVAVSIAFRYHYLDTTKAVSSIPVRVCERALTELGEHQRRKLSFWIMHFVWLGMTDKTILGCSSPSEGSGEELNTPVEGACNPIGDTLLMT